MKKSKNIVVRKSFTPPQEGEQKHHLHMNDNHELYMLLQGDVTFSIEGRLYHLEPYDVLLISNQEIQCVMVNSEMAYERICIFFKPEYFQQFSTKEYDLLRAFNNNGRVEKGNKIGYENVRKYGLDQCFVEMYEQYMAKLPERSIQLTSMLLHMLLDINKAYEESRLIEGMEDKSSGHSDKIDDIIRYISENLSEKITLDDLTRRFYLSKYYLCHEFKRITGFTVFDYIRYKRILSAKTKMQDGQMINEVWRELGYEDYSNFYRTFKKITGMSPKEYMENVKKRKEDNEKESK